MSSNAYYKYRSLTDVEARKVFTVPRKRITDEIVVTATLQGDIIGFFSLVNYNGPELYDFFLAPDFIGKGYGKIMFYEMKKMARNQGWKKLEWQSDPFARGFYLKMGAIEVPDKIEICPLNPKFQSPRFEYYLE